MIPKILDDNEGLTLDFEEEQQPTKTFRLDHERKRVIGYTDDKEAMKQAIYLALSTIRYENVIFSWNYGAELNNLIGKPIPYVYSEIKRIITEALTQDDRIESVDAFSFYHKKGKVHVTYTAHTIFGEIQADWEVSI